MGFLQERLENFQNHKYTQRYEANNARDKRLISNQFGPLDKNCSLYILSL